MASRNGRISWRGKSKKMAGLGARPCHQQLLLFTAVLPRQVAEKRSFRYRFPPRHHFVVGRCSLKKDGGGA